VRPEDVGLHSIRIGTCQVAVWTLSAQKSSEEMGQGKEGAYGLEGMVFRVGEDGRGIGGFL